MKRLRRICDQKKKNTNFLVSEMVQKLTSRCINYFTERIFLFNKIVFFYEPNSSSFPISQEEVGAQI